MTRRVLLVAHTGRTEAIAVAREAAKRLTDAGIGLRVLAAEAEELSIDGAEVAETEQAGEGVELVLVLGGDGTLLRAAELARPTGTPLIAVNAGHVGFLAESEPDLLEATVTHLLRGEYGVEERMTVEVTTGDGRTDWALNEVTVEKAARERMIEVVAEVDGQPLSRYGCDGLVVATPTGSTAYAFSAGGPIVAPDVESMLLVPISAHALFARPLVMGPGSVIAVEVLSGSAVLCCDGRRVYDVEPGTRIEVHRGTRPVRLARIHPTTFTQRLVAKFELPVEGWRGG